jgi:hypothetical protein
MADEADVVVDAGQGAAAGYMAGGVWGAIIGGAVGAVGGLFSKKAKKYRRDAEKEGKLIAEREQAIQRRDIVRNFRMARAQALAAGSSESGGGGSSVAGALGSIDTQGAFNINFFDTQINSQKRIQKLVNKSEKSAAISGAIMSLISSVGQGASSMGSMGGGSKSSSTSSGGSTTSGTSSEPAVSYNNYGTIPMLG